MATKTPTAGLTERVDRFLSYLEVEWADVPRVAHEWDSWTEDKRLDFVLEWSIREDRLHSLRKICERGEMSTEQRARFAQLETVVARNRAAIDRLLDE